MRMGRALRARWRLPTPGNVTWLQCWRQRSRNRRPHCWEAAGAQLMSANHCLSLRRCRHARDGARTQVYPPETMSIMPQLCSHDNTKGLVRRFDVIDRRAYLLVGKEPRCVDARGNPPRREWMVNHGI